MVRFKLRWHTLDPFMATAGHYDNKSPNLVKHLCRGLRLQILISIKHRGILNESALIPQGQEGQVH